MAPGQANLGSSAGNKEASPPEQDRGKDDAGPSRGQGKDFLICLFRARICGLPRTTFKGAVSKEVGVPQQMLFLRAYNKTALLIRSRAPLVGLRERPHPHRIVLRLPSTRKKLKHRDSSAWLPRRGTARDAEMHPVSQVVVDPKWSREVRRFTTLEEQKTLPMPGSALLPGIRGQSHPNRIVEKMAQNSLRRQGRRYWEPQSCREESTAMTCGSTRIAPQLSRTRCHRGQRSINLSTEIK